MVVSLKVVVGIKEEFIVTGVELVKVGAVVVVVNVVATVDVVVRISVDLIVWNVEVVSDCAVVVPEIVVVVSTTGGKTQTHSPDFSQRTPAFSLHLQ